MLEVIMKADEIDIKQERATAFHFARILGMSQRAHISKGRRPKGHRGKNEIPDKNTGRKSTR